MPRLCYQAMLDAGIDGDAVYERLATPVSVIFERDYSYPHAALIRFWQIVEDVSGDADAGLTIGRHLPAYRGDVFEYLLLSSPDFGTGLDRFVAYGRLISDAWIGHLGEDKRGAYFSFDSVMGSVNRLRHQNECYAVGIIRFFRDMTDGQFSPNKLEFACDAPEDIAAREQEFGCSVAYNCEGNRLYFDPTLLGRPSSHAEEEMFQLHEQFAARQLRRIEAGLFVNHVHEVLQALLEHGQATIGEVAARLSVTEAQLQYRLQTAGTSFQRELDFYRHHRACILLAKTEHSIGEVAHLTGFSEPATFYRAFRRWEMMTPAEFRARYKKPEQAAYGRKAAPELPPWPM